MHTKLTDRIMNHISLGKSIFQLFDGEAQLRN